MIERKPIKHQYDPTMNQSTTNLFLMQKATVNDLNEYVYSSLCWLFFLRAQSSKIAITPSKMSFKKWKSHRKQLKCWRCLF